MSHIPSRLKLYVSLQNLPLFLHPPKQICGRISRADATASPGFLIGMMIGASWWLMLDLEHKQEICSCCDQIWERWESIVTTITVT